MQQHQQPEHALSQQRASSGAAAEKRPQTARVHPPAAPVNATVTVPGSKSLTNRALLLAALATGRSVIRAPLFSDDTTHMLNALQQLGVQVDVQAEQIAIDGLGGNWRPTEATLYAGNAGTVARFLTAALALSPHRYRLDGNERMRMRPIGPLLDGLRQLGVTVVDRNGNGCLPIELQGPLRPGDVTLDAGVSSQFVSALLMALPLVDGPSRLRLAERAPAEPYIAMTLQAMADFGVTPPQKTPDGYAITGGQRYRATDYLIEPDASSASYFWAAAAVTGGAVTVRGITRASLQGDARFVDVLAEMGCRVESSDEGMTVYGPAGGVLRGIDVDLNAMSDMTPTLAAIAPYADGPVRIRNVGHIRVQESDRLHALATELSRLGIKVEEGDDWLVVHPGRPQPGRVRTYDDHRLAMAFAVLSLRAPGIEIDDPLCVAKTVPDFFERLQAIGVRVEIE